MFNYIKKMFKYIVTSQISYVNIIPKNANVYFYPYNPFTV